MPSCLKLLLYPDERLLTPSKAVEFPLSAEDLALVEDLTETMYAHKACGLGANQVGSDRSIFLIDLKVCGVSTSSQVGVFINPAITEFSRDKQKGQESCLSLPGITYTVSRSESVEVAAFDLEGKQFIAPLSGLAARAAQHEADHLEGKLFIDRIGHIGKQMALKRLSKSSIYSAR